MPVTIYLVPIFIVIAMLYLLRINTALLANNGAK
jgi:hypothetical protein